MSDSPGKSATAIPTAALALGLGGVIPFAGCALMLWFPSLLPSSLFGSESTDVTRAMLAYGAVILSFLGGIRWGAHMLQGQQAANVRLMGMSVLPSLLAWVALLVNTKWGFSLLLAGIIGQWFVDRNATSNGLLPNWFGKLRLLLTVAVAASLALALGRLLVTT